MKAPVLFVIGVYAIVFLVLTIGLTVGVPQWLLGSVVFVLVLGLGLWLGLRSGRG